MHRLPLLASLSRAFIASFRRDDEVRAAVGDLRPTVVTPSYIFERWRKGG